MIYVLAGCAHEFEQFRRAFDCGRDQVTYLHSWEQLAGVTDALVLAWGRWYECRHEIRNFAVQRGLVVVDVPDPRR